eukprot:TRINITY_DN5726_c0_g1_i1.p2 TRINITY_DN5726_c0_g1~~TRINITY_DN5726_c0_g1_i1.p2  ORF type:complete len:455 (-),score=144.72 TRINITY_DN5726_c0_g1_i1:297-1661(-)
MAMKLRARPRTSTATKLAAGGALLALCRHFGPAYSVKGSWEGTLEDLSRLPAGLEPESVSGVSFQGENFDISLADGVMSASYANGPLSMKINEDSLWAANFTGDNTLVRLNGQGKGGVTWHATKTGNVPGLGDVEVDVNSDNELEVDVIPSEWNVGGVELQVKSTSNADGIAARLEAEKSLNELDLKYAVENTPGVYGLKNLNHVVTAATEVAGGKAAAAYSYDSFGHNYNLTYARDVAGGAASLEWLDGSEGRGYNASFATSASALEGSQDITVGVDDDGAYGGLTASKGLGDVTATMDLTGRVALESKDLSHAEALKLAHELGSVTISSKNGGDIDLSGDFAMEQAENKLTATVGYTVGGAEPTYNVTFARDLSEVVKGDAGLEVGIDKSGPYGALSASKDIGSGFGLELSSRGYVKDLEHRLKLSHDVGYAELVKAQDRDLKLRLGYDLEV